MQLYTIGFTKKSAAYFFDLLQQHDVQHLTDTRVSNNSQLAGFAKGSDLEFFSKTICQIPYTHDLDFAPTRELLSQYRKKEIDWFLYGLQTFFPEAWQKFVEPLNPTERKDILATYYERLKNPDPAIHMPAARNWIAGSGFFRRS